MPIIPGSPRSIPLLASLASALIACGGLVESVSAVASEPSDQVDAGEDGASSAAPHPDTSAPDAASPSLVPAADDVCTPTSVGAGIFDPDCVYILGSIVPGSASGNAVFHPDRPGDFATGGYAIRASFSTTIRGSNGRLVFGSPAKQEAGERDTNSVKIFEYTGPSSPTYNGNRVRVPGIECVGPMRSRFWTFPDDGAVLYDCDDALKLAGVEEPLYRGSYRALVAAPNRTLFAYEANVSPYAFAWIKDGVITPVEPFEADIVAMRSRPTGTLWMATSRIESNAPVFELREIAADGTSQVLGTYRQGSPEPWRLTSACALEPTRALVCVASGSTRNIRNVVVRLTFDAEPVVIFDDHDPVVSLSGGELITGP